MTCVLSCPISILFSHSIGILFLTMKHLDLIKWIDDNGDVKKFSLSSHVSSKWREFGRQLNLEEDRMDGWEQQRMGNCLNCWCIVMSHWLSEQVSSNYEVSWDGLYELLSDVNFITTAKNLKIAVNSAIIVPTKKKKIKNFFSRFFNLKILFYFVPLLVIKIALLWYYFHYCRH